MANGIAFAFHTLCIYLNDIPIWKDAWHSAWDLMSQMIELYILSWWAKVMLSKFLFWGIVGFGVLWLVFPPGCCLGWVFGWRGALNLVLVCVWMLDCSWWPWWINLVPHVDGQWGYAQFLAIKSSHNSRYFTVLLLSPPNVILVVQ